VDRSVLPGDDKQPRMNIKTQQLDTLLRVISEVFEVAPELVRQRCRRFEVVEARSAYYLAASRELHLCPETVARHLDNRSRATISYGISTADAMLSTDSTFRRNYNTVLARIDGTRHVCEHCLGFGLVGVHQGEKPESSQVGDGKGC